MADQSDSARHGNEFFVQKQYEKALEAYSMAIEKNPDAAEVYWNRALTYLKLDRPVHSLHDLDIGLKLKPDNDKLIYRKCTTLLDLRRFSEAGQFLDKSIGRLDHLTNKKNFKALIDDINRLKVEYERGQYDLLVMIEEAKKSILLDNHADYFATNKYELQQIDGKGRGLVAKEKIKAGELLIACKALEVAASELEGDGSMDLINRRMGELSLAPRIEQICNKLSNRPDLAKQLYRLYAGPKLGHLENWTGLDKSDLVDRNRIESIIRYNQLGTDAVLGRPSTISPPVGGFDGGMWLIPSYINHTCADQNCTRYFVGDYIFVRATKSIEEGEEILFSYVSSGSSFEERQSICRQFGFECQCRLCATDRGDPIETKRRMEEIRKWMDDMTARMQQLGYFPCDTRTLKNLLQELVRLRPQRDLNYLALQLQIELVDLTYRDDAKESLRLLTDALEICQSFGDFRDALQMSRSEMLHRALRKVGGKNEQKKWERETRRIAKLIYGDERLANVQ